MIQRIMKYWFWDTYDNLGVLFVINMLWSLLNAIIIIFLMYLINRLLPAETFTTLPLEEQAQRVLQAVLSIYLAGIMLFFNPTTFGMYALVRRATFEEKVGFVDFFKGMAKHLLRSLSLLVLNLFVYGLFVVAVLFYLEWMPEPFQQFGAILASITMVFYFFLFLNNLYIIPIMVSQEVNVFNAIRKSALLTMDNMLTSVAIAVFAFLLITISVVTVFPFIFITSALIAVLLFNTYIIAMEKYGDTIKSSKKENRGLGKFFKPWEN